MSFDFAGADSGTYPSFDGSKPLYGPSSAHAAVVMHAMGDGSVQSLSKDIDAAAYMFLITRSGSDPNGLGEFVP